jgi:surface antigen
MVQSHDRRGVCAGAGAGKDVKGKACRQYSLTATRGKTTEKRQGTACQTAVGVWSLAD